MFLKNIVGRLSKKTPTARAPSRKLSWSEIVKECYDKQLSFVYPVISVTYTDDQTERAVILQKEDQSYTIVFEKLYPYDDYELQYATPELPGYWSPNNHSMNSIFDTVERAENSIFSEPPFKCKRT